MKTLCIVLLACLLSISSACPQSSKPEFLKYICGQCPVTGDKLPIEIEVPGKAPEFFRVPTAKANQSSVLIDSVPAYSWSFGCSNTSAAMIAGYYDLHGFPEIYTAITNDGIAPLDNILWGTVTINGETRNQCPLSASMLGLDERQERGHVDDFWIVYRNFGPDPFIANGWPRHQDADCTGDFMGTNQSLFGNSDGTTRFFFIPDGSPLNDYTGNEPARRDGCHGMRLFFESRGYQVLENYTQLIQGVYGNQQGFTYEQYKEEIDNNRPLILQLAGHSMVGLGYNSAGNLIYLHDTWDNSLHSMPWGGSYAGMSQWGVTVLRLVSANSPPQTNFTAVNTEIVTGSAVQFLDQTLYNPQNWEWMFEGGTPMVAYCQNPTVTYTLPGEYMVKLRTTNAYGYDTQTRYGFIHVSNPSWCSVSSGGGVSIEEFRLSSISNAGISGNFDGYSDFHEQVADMVEGKTYPVLVKASNAPENLRGGIWIDWNRDFDFSDENEFLPLSGHNGSKCLSTLINIPNDPDTGLYRLRVRISCGNAVYSCGYLETGETEDYSIRIYPDTSAVTLRADVFLEGLFDPAIHRMYKALDANEGVFPGEVADLIDIDLFSAESPDVSVASARNLALMVDGSCETCFLGLPFETYYIRIRHRNSLETWSAEAVSFSSQSVTIDFTGDPFASLGQNVKVINGTCCIFCGDTNQDGIVDSGDMDDVESLNAEFETGYRPEDLNGDGLIDSGDAILIENNASAFVGVISP